MSKVAMFGGSFNPVHSGHTALAEKMIESFSLDKVYVIPTFSTPLKDNTPMLSPEHRLNMCKLAFKDINNAYVSDIEIARQGSSYTADTLSELRRMHPDDELFIITGADSFLQLPQWHNPQEIFEYATILTVSRGDVDFVILNEVRNRYIREYGASVEIIEEPIALISSTEIRQLIAENMDVSNRLHPDVYKYIIECELYKYEH